MKALLATWYKDNVGSALQAMALQRCILDFGIDADVLNYTPDLVERSKYYLYNPSKLPKIIDRCVMARSFARSPNRQLFDDFFTKHMGWSEPAHNLKDARRLAGRYDVFICGSDQIWKPTSFNPLYYLGFCSPSSTKIAYGVSLGVETPDELRLDKTKRYMDRFSAVSLREELLCADLRDILGKRIARVCDPTLLFDSSFYGDYCDQCSAEGTIFFYFTKNNIRYQYLVRLLGDALGRRITLYAPECPTVRQAHADNSVYAGPSEWLSLVRSADAVVTDSYHGLIFSLQFNKPFLFIDSLTGTAKEGQLGRIVEMLQLCGQEDRITSFDQAIEKLGCLEDRLDETRFSAVRHEMAITSRKWLEDAILNS